MGVKTYRHSKEFLDAKDESEKNVKNTFSWYRTKPFTKYKQEFWLMRDRSNKNYNPIHNVELLVDKLRQLKGKHFVRRFAIK